MLWQQHTLASLWQQYLSCLGGPGLEAGGVSFLRGQALRCSSASRTECPRKAAEQGSRAAGQFGTPWPADLERVLGSGQGCRVDAGVIRIPELCFGFDPPTIWEKPSSERDPGRPGCPGRPGSQVTLVTHHPAWRAKERHRSASSCTRRCVHRSSKQSTAQSTLSPASWIC